MIADYWFSVDSTNNGNTNENEVKQHHGKIHIFNIDHEPYDITVEAIQCSFHLIFGSQINGKFLCIPNWNVGFELGPYDDELWNLSSIMSSGKISYKHSVAIVKALSLLNKFIQ